MDSIKDVVRSSVKVPKFDKHLKKAGGHIGRNVVEITLNKTIVGKPLMIKNFSSIFKGISKDTVSVKFSICPSLWLKTNLKEWVRVSLSHLPQRYLKQTIPRRNLWCNGYRCRKWTRRDEFKFWIRLIIFHIELIPLGKVWIQLFSFQVWENSRTQTEFFSLGEATSQGEGKLWIQTC